MKILVLGATGFLGSHVCKTLDDRQLPYEKTSNSLGLDLLDRDATLAYFKNSKPTIVLNCAAFVGGIQFGYKYPADLLSKNLRMQTNIFDACVAANVQRLINPISNCAYPGDASVFKEDEFWNGPLHESVRAYGFARKELAVASEAYRKQHGLDTICLILSNMYGPGDHFDEERSHALGALIKKIVDAKNEGKTNVVVWGSGTPVREWLHVRDGAESMVRAIDIKSQENIVNIGVQSGISIKDMVDMIVSCVGYEGELSYDTSKPDGAPYKTVDGTKGKKVFGWAPETNLREGIQETVDWYTKWKK